MEGPTEETERVERDGWRERMERERIERGWRERVKRDGGRERKGGRKRIKWRSYVQGSFRIIIHFTKRELS